MPAWQTLYFANSNLMTRHGALTCEKSHSEVGVLISKGSAIRLKRSSN
jgi:hypothetical protein